MQRRLVGHPRVDLNNELRQRAQPREPRIFDEQPQNLRGILDAPVDTLSGESAGGSVACILFGSTKPLTAEQLSARYRSRDDYRREYRAAVQRAIASGFVLADDRPDLLAMAQPDRIPA